MSGVLVAVGSVKGSPGATTLAVTLAAVWPDGPAVVIEADCAGGDLGGRCWLPDTPGRASLATGVRSGTVSLTEHLARLPCEVQVVVAPAGRHPATVAVGLLAEAGPAGWAKERATIVDVGRLDPGTPAAGLVEVSEVLLVCTRGDEASLMRLADAGLPSQLARVIVVGGSDYRLDEIAAAVGLPVAAMLPWDARAAQVVWGQAKPSRAWTKRGLPAVVRSLACDLAGGGAVTPPDGDHNDDQTQTQGQGLGLGLGARPPVARQGGRR